MAGFAKINDDNEVLTVLYMEDEKIQNEAGELTESIGQQHLQTHNNWPAEKWIQTDPNTQGNEHKLGGTPFRGNHAGIGYTWDSANNIFWSPKPFPSWVKNTTIANWDPPIAKPALTAEQQSQNTANTHTWVHEWNEEGQSWTLADLGPEVL
jgi:hypothetical protein